jgi:hypothetical protein
LLKQSDLDSLTNSRVLGNSGGAGYFIYNPGDLPTDVKISINKNDIVSNLTIKLMHRV